MATLSLKIKRKESTQSNVESTQSSLKAVQSNTPKIPKLDAAEPIQVSVAKPNTQLNLEVQNALAWLFNRFPKCFNLQKRLPLELSVKKKIIALVKDEEDRPSYKDIRKAVKYYKGNLKYHLGVIYQTHRIDLEGTHAQQVDIKAKEIAKVNRAKISPYDPKKHKKKKLKEQQKEANESAESCYLH